MEEPKPVNLKDLLKRETELQEKRESEKVNTIKKKLQSSEEVIQWVQCPKCKGEVNKLLETGVCFDCNFGPAAPEASEKKRERLVERLGGLKAYEEFSFTSYMVGEKNKPAFVACRSFDPSRDNLYLFGPPGVGKSHLASAVVRGFLLSGTDALVCRPLDLSLALRMREVQEERDELTRLATIPVLVVDELGIGNYTEFIKTILYQIVDKRMRDMRNGLIFTSNLSLEDLMNKMGDDRLTSRISGMCKVIKVEGRDFRQLKKTEALKA